MEFVAIDFETTGVEGGGVNEPWQLGLAHVRDGEIVEAREWFFRTERPFAAVPPTAYQTVAEAWSAYGPYVTGRRLVAHNIACERTILTRIAPLSRLGPWVDTLKLAKARYPKLASYRLGDLCASFGCVPDLPGRTWHDGLYDAVACALLALRLGGFGG